MGREGWCHHSSQSYTHKQLLKGSRRQLSQELSLTQQQGQLSSRPTQQPLLAAPKSPNLHHLLSLGHSFQQSKSQSRSEYQQGREWIDYRIILEMYSTIGNGSVIFRGSKTSQGKLLRQALGIILRSLTIWLISSMMSLVWEIIIEGLETKSLT